MPRPRIYTLPSEDLTPPALAIDERYPLLMELIRRLPASRRWTRQERDRWWAAVVACLDLEIEIIEPGGPYLYQSAMKERG